MKPRALPIALLLCLSGACVHRGTAPRQPPTAPAVAPAPVASAPADTAMRFGLTMTSQPLPPGPHGTPRQRLALVLRLPSGTAQTQDLGEVTGTCTALPPPPEVLGLYHCEAAGTGSEFVIRRNGPEIVVTRLGVELGTATAQSREVARMTAPAGDVVTFQVAP